MLVLSAKEAKAEKNFQNGVLSLFPRHIDVETFNKSHDVNNSAESLIINFEKLEQPLEFQISRGKQKNLKRMGFFEVFDKAKNSSDPESEETSKGYYRKKLRIRFISLFYNIFNFTIFRKDWC